MNYFRNIATRLRNKIVVDDKLLVEAAEAIEMLCNDLDGADEVLNGVGQPAYVDEKPRMMAERIEAAIESAKTSNGA